jgi:hypothetical protein
VEAGFEGAFTARAAGDVGSWSAHTPPSVAPHEGPLMETA